MPTAGNYWKNLEKWFEHYLKSKILILKSEDLFENSQATMKKVYNFLGIDPGFCHKVSYEKVNARNYSHQKVSEKSKRTLVDYFRPFILALEENLEIKTDWC